MGGEGRAREGGKFTEVIRLSRFKLDPKHDGKSYVSSSRACSEPKRSPEQIRFTFFYPFFFCPFFILLFSYFYFLLPSLFSSLCLLLSFLLFFLFFFFYLSHTNCPIATRKARSNRPKCVCINLLCRCHLQKIHRRNESLI